MRTLWFCLCLGLAPALSAAPARGEDKPAAERPQGDDAGNGKDPKEGEGEKDLDPRELFLKAVAWQGKPDSFRGHLVDLQVDRLDFKLWGEHEIEGRFKILHTAPDKVRFEVWTKAWWRWYWTDGKAHFRKTGATKGGAEFLNPALEDDRESIALVAEALRIVRLIVLENLGGKDVRFEYHGLQKPYGKPGVPACHLVKRVSPKAGDMKETLYLYLDPADFRPVAIGVMEFLNLRGVFFIHLPAFCAFDGLTLPTRIEVWAQDEDPAQYRKFLFADVVVNPENSEKVRINGGIDDALYGPQKD